MMPVPLLPLEIGGLCNNRCVFCEVQAQGLDRVGAPISAFRDLVEESNAARRMPHLTGGELTVRPDLKAVLRVLSGARAGWSLASNGRMFVYDAVLQRCLHAGMRRVSLSMHGASARTHDAIVGAPAFDQTLSALRRLQLAGVLAEVTVVAGRFNLRELEAVVRVIRRQTAAPIRFVAVRAPGTLREKFNELIPVGEEIDRALRRARDIADGRPSISPARFPEFTRFHRVELLESFDLERCRFRVAQGKIPDPESSLLIIDERGAWRCRGDHPVGDQERLRRLTTGVVREPVAGGTLRVYRLALECAACESLAPCGGTFRIDPDSSGEHARRPPPATDETPDLTITSFEALDQAIERLEPGQRLLLRAPTPACLLAAHDDPTVPRMRDAPDAVSLARGMSGRPVRLIATRFPEHLGEDAYELGYERSAEAIPPAPEKLAVLMITRSCPARCVMCNIPEFFKAPDPPLPRLLRLLDECAISGYRLVDLFGGDVTSRPDLPHVIRYARALDLYVMFITTGFRLTDRYVGELLDAGVDKVTVALDSPSPLVHDAIKRVSGLFERAVAGIRRLTKATGVWVEVNTVILRENVRDLVALLELSASLGVHRHRFFHVVRSPAAAPEGSLLTAEEAEHYLRHVRPALRKRGRELGMHIDFCPEFRETDATLDLWRDRLARGVYNNLADLGLRCHAPETDLFVNVDGDVYPCANPSLWGRVAPVGNVYRSSLADIRRGEAWKAFSCQAGAFESCGNCVTNRFELLPG